MQLFRKLARWVNDPPPDYVFEISEAGIAWARSGAPQPGFTPLAPGVLQVSPLKDNVRQPEAFQAAVKGLVNGAGARKRRPAAVILPDYCARVAVLDFDSFPSSPEEQGPLVRFRAKKAVPFDIDAAALSFTVQQRPGSKRYDVVAAVVALEILARYEAAFRAAGLHPGLVTTSSLAALSLVPGDGLTVTVKAAGRVLTAAVQQGTALRLLRCVELDALNREEVMGVLYPTVAFTEDEMGQRPARLYLCGLGALAGEIQAVSESELGLPAEPLRSRFGVPGPNNAGLLGYLEATRG